MAFAAVRDRYAPAEGARIYSYLNGALCSVPALAPMLGGALAVLAGWRSTFVFMALFALTLALLLARRFGETRPPAAGPAARVAGWRQYLPIATSGRFVYFAVFGMAGMAMILVFVSAAPVVLVQRLGYSELGFGAWFGGNAVLNIVAFFLAPRFIARFGRMVMLRAGLIALLLAAAMHLAAWLWLPLSAWAFMLPVAVLTVGFSLALGSALSLALEPYPDRAGHRRRGVRPVPDERLRPDRDAAAGPGHEPAAGHGADRRAAGRTAALRFRLDRAVRVPPRLRLPRWYPEATTTGDDMSTQSSASPALEPLLLRTDSQGIVTLRLNRPGQFNALSEALLAALQARRSMRWPATRACAAWCWKPAAAPSAPGMTCVKCGASRHWTTTVSCSASAAR